MQSLRGTSRSTLKQSLNRILSACKRPTNQRLCKRFLYQLRSLFEDDYEDEDSHLVGIELDCKSTFNSAEKCFLDFSCWAGKFEEIKSCLETLDETDPEAKRCKQVAIKGTSCNNISCLLGMSVEIESCRKIFSF